MSDETPKPKRVAFVTRDGQFGTVDASDAANMPHGTRILSAKEAKEREEDIAQQAAQAREDERYDKTPAAAKVLGGIATAASAVMPGAALTFGAGAAPGTAPAAYSSGVTEGLTGGLGQGVIRQGIDATLGKDVGDKYAQQVADQKVASPYAHGVGNIVGTGTGLVAGAGGAAEQLATKGLARAGVQATSALGKAGVAAAKLGVRGAVEGGIIGGGEYAGEQLLQDHDVAADKLFSAIGTGSLYGAGVGAALGGGLSLAGSGIKGIRGALSRARPSGSLAGEAESTARGFIGGLVDDLGTEAGTKNRAYDQLFTQAGSGRGLQSSDFVKRADRYLENGTRDVAETWMRKGVFDPRAGIVDASKAGSPAAMLPKSEAALAAVGKEIGDLTAASGGRVKGQEIMSAVESVAKKYDYAATKPIARAIRSFGSDLESSLKLGDFGFKTDGFTPASNVNAYGQRVYNDVAVQDLIAERKAVDRMVFDNAALDASATIEAKRELRSKLEDLVVKSLDETSGKLPGELKAKYLGLKKDYLALSIGHDLLEDSAARDAKHAFLGLSDLTAGNGSIIKSIAYKIAKRNVHAVAAAQLYQEAERGTLARWINKTDDQIARASKGLIAAPEKGAAKASEVMPPPRQLVSKTLARVAAFQADPDAFVDHASRQVESIATHSPEIADGIVTRQVRAMSLLSSKLPQQGEPDPLDPHKRVEMTPSEEASFARYAWYAEKPERFFAEVSRGKLTPEGAETAQALMPRAFEQLQQETFEALTTQLARGNKLPFRQRELLGQLLDFAATPTQRPQHRAFLQQNVADVLPSNEPPLSAAPAKSRRATTPPSGSDALDRLEAKGPGRR